MRPVIIALTVVSALAAITGVAMIFKNESTSARFMKSSPVQDAWTAWKMTNGKSYGTNSEETYRQSMFAENYSKVQDFDTVKYTFTIGLNQYADMGFAEFKSVYLGIKKPSTPKNVKASKLTSVSASQDWTGKAVTDVKNQAQCGSCWAFSATGGAEGAYAIANGTIKSFSEQQLVDCAGGSYGNQGCNGGLMDQAFDYMKDNGIQLESSYQYTARDGTCRADPSLMAFKIDSYTDVPQDDNSELIKAIYAAPVSVAIAVDFYFQAYTGGIYNHWSCGTGLDHGVLAVGYGSDNGQDFYKVKNSWGTVWGEEGYIRFARKDSGVGMCGITRQASYPSVDF